MSTASLREGRRSWEASIGQGGRWTVGSCQLGRPTLMQRSVRCGISATGNNLLRRLRVALEHERSLARIQREDAPCDVTQLLGRERFLGEHPLAISGQGMA